MNSTHNLIGRQPILNRQEEIVAFELLFRSSKSPSSATVKCSTQATSSVIVNIISGFGVEDILGRHPGFINVDTDMLMSDAIELLPPEMIGFELLESIEINDEIINRCRALKLLGFCLALDDHEYDTKYIELYSGIVDIVKIDLIATPLNIVYQTVEQLNHYPVKLLAEKVDTRHCYLRSRTMGFDLFQGFFFSRPSVMQKRRMEDSSTTFFKLVNQLSHDAEVSDIEHTFKQSPALTYKLLMLVNSVAIGRREKIRSVRHAITLIGLLQLKRWVQLAVFADDGNQGLNNPILEMVAVRAAFMEEVARLHPKCLHDSNAPEEAFMVGTLSLLQQIYDISINDIVNGLNLSEETKCALTEREGVLGELLILSEMIEQIKLDEASQFLAEKGISIEAVFECQKRAYKWHKEL